jgi:hypothetical protein
MAAPLSISALSLDLAVALAQRPRGAGSTELARIVDGPKTTVQSALRVLAQHGLVARSGRQFTLARQRPGVEELVTLALRLPEPEAAIRLVLRASDVVEFACIDPGGFIVGERLHVEGDEMEAFETSLQTIAQERADVLPVLRFELGELVRITHSAIGLRTRVAGAEIVKGRVRRLGPPAAPLPPEVPSR